MPMTAAVTAATPAAAHRVDAMLAASHHHRRV